MDIKTNSQIYEIIQKMPEFGLNKGDLLYLDKFHGDHIEVFRNRQCVNVFNLDGTVYQNAGKAIGRDLLIK